MRRLIGIAGLLILIGLAVNKRTPVQELMTGTTARSPEACRIKGNINLQGERIYHVPGGAWYQKTHVNIERGDRWFCTEEEARRAGWRRSYE